jgi:aspartyl-tRNA(Asn)/glutamyl-tRNA(Gln) amidotransferase subunit C
MEQLIKTLPAILKASGVSAEVAEAACIGAWKHAIGEGLSSHAVALQLQGSTLIVAVDDEMWRKQLHQMRGQFMFRLNSVLGQVLVKSIEFRIDPKRLAQVRGPEDGVSKDRGGREYKVPVELVAAAAAIEDAELRRAFLGAATSCVRRLEDS